MFWQTSYYSPEEQALDLTDRFIVLNTRAGGLAVGSGGVGYDWPKDAELLHSTAYAVFDTEAFNLIRTKTIVEPGVTLFADFLQSAEFILQADLDASGGVSPGLVDNGLHYRFGPGDMAGIRAITIQYDRTPTELILILQELTALGWPGMGVGGGRFDESTFKEGRVVEIGANRSIAAGSYWDGINHVLHVRLDLPGILADSALPFDFGAIVSIGSGFGALSDSYLYARAIFGSGQADEIDGSLRAESIMGYARADVLHGGRGSDVLNGGAGVDRLTGGPGPDQFTFTAAPGTGVDSISDMGNGSDTIALDDAVFAGLGFAGGGGPSAKGAAGPHHLLSKHFVVGPRAADRSDRVIYDPATGNLWHDADGNRAGVHKVLFARLDKDLDLRAADFLVI